MNAAKQTSPFPPAASRSKTTPLDAPLTIDEFCRRYRMSRSRYFDMKHNGQAPDDMRIGRQTVIPAASVRAWERRVMQDTKAAKAAAKTADRKTRRRI